MAVEEAVENPAFFRAMSDAVLERMLWGRTQGLTFAGRRDVWGVLGYPQVISSLEYRERYSRGGIAGRVVDALPKAAWRGAGVVYEDEDPEVDTEFETAWDKLNDQHRVWSTLQRAHILAQLGSFSALLIGASGNLSEPLPPGQPGQILYLTPFLGGVASTLVTGQRGPRTDTGADASVATWDTDIHSPRFGQPVTYSLKRTNVASTDLSSQVHYTRVLHIPASGFLDDAVFGPPALEGVWNYLEDLDKVEGGGSEAFWLRANAGVQFDIDKKMGVAGQTGPLPTTEELAELKKQADDYAHQMTRAIRTRGVNINQLGSDVADFKGPVDALLTLIAGTCGIPKRILTGSEMGQMASTEDRDNWNDQVKDCRTAHAYPVILQPFIKRLIDNGYLPTPKQWDVEWPDIESMSEDEKLDAAKKAMSLNSAGEIVITGAEVREQFLDLEPLDDDVLQTETWRADLAVKMTTANKTQGAVVFTDDEIRKITYDKEPLTDAQKIPLTAPERVSATAPTPLLDENGKPKLDAQGQPILQPVAPAAVPAPAKVLPFKAAEMAEELLALEAAIEAKDLTAIGKILGVPHGA